jgi:hypothetical protein
LEGQIRPEILKKTEKNYWEITVWKEATVDYEVYYPGNSPGNTEEN